ncbi:MAG: hypothetical protein MZW92_17270 [Comamonadaceae bacterium]|nr:hypothetical protein [Comamonadaceae bacterium]
MRAPIGRPAAALPRLRVPDTGGSRRSTSAPPTRPIAAAATAGGAMCSLVELEAGHPHHAHRGVLPLPTRRAHALRGRAPATAAPRWRPMSRASTAG